MAGQKMHNTVVAVAIVFVMATFASIAAAQVSEALIHQFTGPDGVDPQGQLLVDSSGNIYGTAQNGGTSTACLGGCGVVFEISPISGGGWQYRVIHDFSSGQDGAIPHTSLSMDSAGNIYGTTLYGGGVLAFDCSSGCGTVFMLSPSASGEWSETILHRFQSLADGRSPIDGVAIDAAGNLYGVTEFSDNETPYIGEVYELSPSAGKWKFTTLHNFLPPNDGDFPVAGVVLDSAGNLYGNTQFGGNAQGCYQQGCGVVYELSPSSSGAWTEAILYEFPNLAGNPGSIPSGRIVRDAAGNIYGTTEYGGEISSNCAAPGCGTVFKLFNDNGTWMRETLHFFGQNAGDGKNPIGPLTIDAAGNLYGTTQYGGESLGTTLSHGIAFKLSTVGTSAVYTPLHSFNNFAGGEIPWAGVTPDSQGNLWGTTYFGGIFQQDDGDGYGVVFELTAAQ